VNDVALIAAGCLALIAAAIHGGVGDVVVVRRLSLETLSSSRFGGPRMTMAMIHVTWHIATIAFLVIGIALLLAGTVLDADEARAIAFVGAGAFTGFGALALGIGFAHTRTPRAFLRHPGPLVLTAVGVLALLGAV
jgi:hypothetical protein